MDGNFNGGLIISTFFEYVLVCTNVEEFGLLQPNLSVLTQGTSFRKAHMYVYVGRKWLVSFFFVFPPTIVNFPANLMGK